MPLILPLPGFYASVGTTDLGGLPSNEGREPIGPADPNRVTWVLGIGAGAASFLGVLGGFAVLRRLTRS